MSRSYFDPKTNNSGTLFNASNSEIILALTTMISKNCQGCLDEIKVNGNNVEIFSISSTTAKYNIRDKYIGNVLHIPLTNVSGQYLFYISKTDALANSVVQNQIKELRLVKEQPWEEKPTKTLDTQDLAAKKKADGEKPEISVEGSIKIVAFLNVFFSFSPSLWVINRNLISLHGPSISYARIDAPHRGQKFCNKIISDDFEISNLGESLGFNSDFIKELRKKITVEDHKSGCFYYFKKEDQHVLHPILNMIELMESALKRRFDIPLKEPEQNQQTVTARLKEFVSAYAEYYQANASEKLETHMSRDLVGIVSNYLGVFNSSKPEEQKDDKKENRPTSGHIPKK